MKRGRFPMKQLIGMLDTEESRLTFDLLHLNTGLGGS